MANMSGLSFTQLLLLLASLTVSVSAGFTNFYLNTTGACVGNAITCTPGRSMCAHEDVNNIDYCCDTLSDANPNLCYTVAPNCDGVDGGPSSVQQSCRGIGEQVEDRTWCCLKEYERCTTATSKSAGFKGTKYA